MPSRLAVSAAPPRPAAPAPRAGEAEPDDVDAIDEPPVDHGPEHDPAHSAPPEEPPEWTTRDAQVLVLPLPVWTRWGGWSPGYQRRWPARARPTWPRALRRLRSVVSSARRVGTLRHRRSGARFPVYRGRLGGRSYRIVTRPRGPWRQEIVRFGPEPDVGARQSELFPLGESRRASPEVAGTTRDGFRLRLPHARVHSLLSRLQPDQVRRLSGGRLDVDPAPALSAAVRRLARGARKVGAFSAPGGSLPVFAAAGYRILVRPISPAEGEILTLVPAGELEEEASAAGGFKATMRWVGPLKFGWGQLFSPMPSAIGPSDGGIYIIEKRIRSGWTPVYVGKADSFAKRLGTRREILRQMAVSPRYYRVWLGKVTSANPPLLTALEHVVLRTIVNWNVPPTGPLTQGTSFRGSGRGDSIAPLTNLSPRKPFRLQGNIEVKLEGQVPAYLRYPTGSRDARIFVPAGEWFEI